MGAPPVFEVGQFYRVPCIRIGSNGPWFKEGQYVPVLLPAHSDPELRLPQMHYHLDFRFVVGFDTPQDMARVIVAEPSSVLVVMRRRKCRREQPQFPHAGTERFAAWEAGYLDKKIDTKTLICPHKGVCLIGAPVKDGVVACPGHGLNWNVETGECVPYHSILSAPEVKPDGFVPREKGGDSADL